MAKLQSVSGVGIMGNRHHQAGNKTKKHANHFSVA